MDKVCKRCGESKDMSLFPVHLMKKDRRGSWCRECVNKRNREEYNKRKTDIKKEDINKETVKKDSIVEWLKDKLDKCDNRSKVETFIKVHKEEIQDNKELFDIARERLKDSDKPLEP